MTRPVCARLFVSFVLVATAAVTDVFAQEDSLKDRFLAQYAPSARKLKKFYGNVKMSASYTRERKIFRPATNTKLRYDVLFKARDPLFLVETTCREDQEQEKAVPGTMFVQGVNRHGTFGLERRARDNKFLILTLRENQVGWQRVLINDASFAFAPFCHNDETLEEFLGASHNQVVKWEEVAAENRKLVRISYRYRREKLDYGGWFLFSPENSWALLQSGRGKSESNPYVVVDYENLDEKTPRLREVRKHLSDDTGILDETWHLLEITPGAIPEHEFTLGAYGLPDPWQKPASPLWIVVWVSLGIGVVALVATKLIRWKQRQPTPDSA